MRAAIYARFSSELQRDESIEDQVGVCRREIERQGWTVAKVYTDRAQSGASRFRPQYQRMIADAEQKQFDVLVCEALDRLGRKLADTSSQQKLLRSLADAFGLSRAPRRIEVYDNSHIQGSNAVGAMIVAGPEGFQKNQYRKFNIRSTELTPGDDFGMMRGVLERRFKRLMAEAPRNGTDVPQVPSLHSPSKTGVNAPVSGEGGEPRRSAAEAASEADESESPWPDLVLIDGGQGQLRSAA